MQNFDTTSLPVHTVNAESLSEITTNNFEKVEKSNFWLSPMIYLSLDRLKC